jgi:hypothetical protein
MQIFIPLSLDYHEDFLFLDEKNHGGFPFFSLLLLLMIMMCFAFSCGGLGTFGH